MINVYKNSAFYDDALFERGLIQVRGEKYQDALTSFDQLIREKARSPYVAFALERSAVANFNLGNYQETVRLYRSFIDNYPNGQHALAVGKIYESLLPVNKP